MSTSFALTGSPNACVAPQLQQRADHAHAAEVLAAAVKPGRLVLQAADAGPLAGVAQVLLAGGAIAALARPAASIWISTSFALGGSSSSSVISHGVPALRRTAALVFM
jgi:hypothetical protein